MTVCIDQKYQDFFEAADNMLCQPKQRYKDNKGHYEMAKPATEEVFHVSSYPLLESMDFDTDISDGVAKMSSSTLLGEIVRLHQRTCGAACQIGRASG